MNSVPELRHDANSRGDGEHSSARRQSASHLTARDRAAVPRTIAIVLKGYPRLSETFIAQELLALETSGVALRLFSLRHPTDRATHPIHAAIRASVTYLPEYLHLEPRRVWRAWRKLRGTQGYRMARAIWWRDLLRDPSRSRVRRFGQALVLAAELPDEIVHLHAHFLHTPASVTRYAAALCGLPWSCSAHAKDIWTTPDWEIREKLNDCAWTTTCTASNAQHLREVGGPAAPIDLIYHGLDTGRFPAPAQSNRSRNGGDPSDPVRFLTVGRAVDKKGFDDLLHALTLLPRELSWRLVHIGGGPLTRELQKASRTLGLAERVEWRGPQPHDAVLEAYRAADVFVLPCRVSDDGDRDGLPNVLLEAQSQKLACISTTVSGIPELIDNGVTGMLVKPRDRGMLAQALMQLARDPELRARFAEAGFARVTGTFSLASGAERLRARFVTST